MPDKAKSLEAILAIAGGFFVAYLVTDIRELLYAGLGVMAVGLVSAKLSSYVAWAWLKLAKGLNYVSSRILLSVVYFLILTPIALLSRIGKKDALHLRKQQGTNWSDRDHQYEKEDLENVW